MAETEAGTTNEKERSGDRPVAYFGCTAASARAKRRDRKPKPRKSPNPEKRKDSNLKNKLGITLSDALTVQQHQRNLCGICGRPLTRPYNDHDHRTGLYRGALCWNCNSGLGKFNDDIDRLLGAVLYLAYPPAIIALGQAKFGLPGRITTRRKWREALARKIKQEFTPINLVEKLNACQKKVLTLS